MASSDSSFQLMLRPNIFWSLLEEIGALLSIKKTGPGVELCRSKGVWCSLTTEGEWQSSRKQSMEKKEQRQHFFNNLLNALRPPSYEKAPRHGTFAACEALKPSQGFSLKSLHVEGVGELQLPLSAEDSSKLRSVCQQAPFGKGLTTVVDTNVRRAWQVDASKVTFPGAPEFLSDTVQAVAEAAVCELGLDGRLVQLEAHLYKLLFYEAGGHFAFHRDTEKARMDASTDRGGLQKAPTDFSKLPQTT